MRFACPGAGTVYAAGGDDDGEGLLSVFSVDRDTAELTQTTVLHPGSGLMCGAEYAIGRCLCWLAFCDGLLGFAVLSLGLPNAGGTPNL